MTFWRKEKKIPRWLWGGVIGGVAAMLSLLLNFLCLLSSSIWKPAVPGEIIGFECFFTFGILWALPELFFNLPDVLYTLPEPVFIVAGVIFWFIIGSLVGTIISYIEKRTR